MFPKLRYNSVLLEFDSKQYSGPCTTTYFSCFHKYFFQWKKVFSSINKKRKSKELFHFVIFFENIQQRAHPQIMSTQKRSGKFTEPNLRRRKPYKCIDKREGHKKYWPNIWKSPKLERTNITFIWAFMHSVEKYGLANLLFMVYVWILL